MPRLRRAAVSVFRFVVSISLATLVYNVLSKTTAPTWLPAAASLVVLIAVIVGIELLAGRRLL